MLKNRVFIPPRPEYQEKTVKTVATIVEDGHERVSLIDTPVQDINKGIYSPDVVDATQVLTSGQFIQGNCDYEPSDLETSERLAAPGIQAIIDNSNFKNEES